MASAVPVTLGACLRSATLPAMSAGAAKRKTCHTGKFHGITASTGPSGSKATTLLCASVSTGSSVKKSSACSA